MERKIAVSWAPTLDASAPGTRRRLVLALPLVFLLPPARAASPLAATPAQMLGPFYPLRPDPDAGNDLARGEHGRAQGVPLRIVGAVRDTAGKPLAGVLVEIWQTNAHGRYHHPHDDSPPPLDPNFRGYGRATTDPDGAYRFATIEPVAYPGRTPHVHFRLSRGGRELLVTQMYLPSATAANERDGLYRSVGDAAARRRLLGVAEPGAGGTLRFDIVLAAARD
ncbi:MAG: intradiol ring-cleavage dioxygenase [Rhodocyclales bacterium]|nr:intradiol ring-cleavage dioxygenase [Rhodocyclales bacterium]